MLPLPFLLHLPLAPLTRANYDLFLIISFASHSSHFSPSFYHFLTQPCTNNVYNRFLFTFFFIPFSLYPFHSIPFPCIPFFSTRRAVNTTPHSVLYLCLCSSFRRPLPSPLSLPRHIPTYRPCSFSISTLTRHSNSFVSLSLSAHHNLTLHSPYSIFKLSFPCITVYYNQLTLQAVASVWPTWRRGAASWLGYSLGPRVCPWNPWRRK